MLNHGFFFILPKKKVSKSKITFQCDANIGESVHCGCTESTSKIPDALPDKAHHSTVRVKILEQERDDLLEAHNKVKQFMANSLRGFQKEKTKY